MMRRRLQIIQAETNTKAQAVMDDYYKRRVDGSFVYSIKEIAKKHSMSVPNIYKILERAEQKEKRNGK